MRLKFLMLPALLIAMLTAVPAVHAAQVTLGIQVGSAPACPYGYYDYLPYRCAPYGYYGPEWFSNGVFIGAGPWYHGRRDFYGHVDHRFDPRYGYRGSYPRHDEHFDNHRDFRDFHGNSMRDGHGHERSGGHSDHDRH
jgi:hypothetical protein